MNLKIFRTTLLLAGLLAFSGAHAGPVRSGLSGRLKSATRTFLGGSPVDKLAGGSGKVSEQLVRDIGPLPDGSFMKAGDPLNIVQTTNAVVMMTTKGDGTVSVIGVSKDSTPSDWELATVERFRLFEAREGSVRAELEQVMESMVAAGTLVRGEPSFDVIASEKSPEGYYPDAPRHRAVNTVRIDDQIFIKVAPSHTYRMP